VLKGRGFQPLRKRRTIHSGFQMRFSNLLANSEETRMDFSEVASEELSVT
jgi:hypothetical protein